MKHRFRNFHKSSRLAASKNKTQDTHFSSHMLKRYVDTRNISANHARSARLRFCTIKCMSFFSFSLHEIINRPKIGTTTVNYCDSIEEWMSHQFTTFFSQLASKQTEKKSASGTQCSLERKRQMLWNSDELLSRRCWLLTKLMTNAGAVL